jgi:hypothetical protein
MKGVNAITSADESDGNQLEKRPERVSFVMVLWLEEGEFPEGPEWRWRVTRVQTGRKKYFRRVADVLSYVSAEAGVAPPR